MHISEFKECSHNKDQNPAECNECINLSTCEHNKRFFHCLSCREEVDCIHKLKKKNCYRCYPIYCNDCKMVYSTNINHYISTTHIKKVGPLKAGQDYREACLAYNKRFK
jgi:hypothetical protein